MILYSYFTPFFAFFKIVIKKKASFVHDASMVCALNQSNTFSNNSSNSSNSNATNNSNTSNAMHAILYSSVLRRLDLTLQILESSSFLCIDNQIHLATLDVKGTENVEKSNKSDTGANAVCNDRYNSFYQCITNCFFFSFITTTKCSFAFLLLYQ